MKNLLVALALINVVACSKNQSASTKEASDPGKTDYFCYNYGGTEQEQAYIYPSQGRASFQDIDGIWGYRAELKLVKTNQLKTKPVQTEYVFEGKNEKEDSLIQLFFNVTTRESKVLLQAGTKQQESHDPEACVPHSDN